MRFSTKVDPWIALLFVVILIGVVVAVLASGEPWIALLMIGIWALTGILILPCDYTLEGERLIVRSGVVKWRIPYREIERVYPTRNPLSSPAWSLDRIAIVYRKTWVMVSPKDKVGFVTELMKRAGLEPKGDELVSGRV